jgi:hypothetical protein
MPTPRAADPWGNVRDTKPTSAARAKKTDKNAAGTKKNTTTAKTGDPPKKTN